MLHKLTLKDKIIGYYDTDRPKSFFLANECIKSATSELELLLLKGECLLAIEKLRMSN